MKNYCLFSAHYFPNLGGIESFTYNLAKYLTNKGNHVVIVTSNVEHLAEYEETEGVEIYRLPCINLLDGRYPVLNFFSADFRRLYKRIEKTTFDLIIINARFYVHSVFAARFGYKHHVKTIMIDHGSGHLTVNNKIADVIGEAWEHLITKIDQIYCKDYYGVSLASCKWLEHFGVKAKGVIYNAIDFPELEQNIRNRTLDYRAKYNIPTDAKVIAYTGRLLEYKGVPSIIACVEKLLTQRDDVYLFLAGDGDLWEYVNAHRSSHVIPLGRITIAQVCELLSDSDIFCLPSRMEGFSTSVLEAVVCGCYVITTEQGGAKEMITSRDYGMIIRNNEEETVYHALQEVLDVPEERARATRNCLERLKMNFTWDVVSDQVIEIAENR